MVATKPGLEGQQDIVYELGIFKTNGTPLTNATHANIVIDGTYGKGTADKLDFDMGRFPRLVIKPDMHSAQYAVATKEDTRYESVKTVVVDFNHIYAMSDTDISFGSPALSCKGLLYDQPALLAIESLGDFGRKNNVVSGFFKVSLLRARDGALQTNCSGGDILIDRIFKEIYRVLKPGARFCISDVVLDGLFPQEFTDNAAMYAGCIASAIQREDYLREIARAGLVDIAVVRTKTIAIPNDVLKEHLDKTTIQKYKKGNVGIYSITVTGKRP